MGCAPLYPPLELIHAAGFQPLVLWELSGLVKDSTQGDRHLQNYSCSVARRLAEYVLSKPGESLAGFMFYNACDTLRNLPEILERGLKERGRSLPMFRLHVPAARPDRGYCKDYLANEIMRLKQELSNTPGHEVTDQNFRESVELYRRLRTALLAMEKEAGRGAVPFSRCMEISLSCLAMPIEEAVVLAESELQKSRKKPDGKTGPGVMISGILAPPLSLVLAMEGAGLTVKANDLASLHRSLAWTPSSFEGPEQYYPDFYQNHFPCPTLLHSADQRVGALIALARERKVKGVIFAAEKFCEYEYFEYPYLEKRLKQEGISTLVLELAMGDESLGAMKTRIEAFAEILERG